MRLRQSHKELEHTHLLEGNPARFWGEGVAIAAVLGVSITATSDSVLIVDRIDCEGAIDLAAGLLSSRSTTLVGGPCRLEVAVFVAKVRLRVSGKDQRERRDQQTSRK